jgi:hypothetical protein
MKRISDTRAVQYWDRGRLLSKAMGETNRKSVVWDRVIVYPHGAVWSDAAPPKPLVSVGPVVEELPTFMASLQHALDDTR